MHTVFCRELKQKCYKMQELREKVGFTGQITHFDRFFALTLAFTSIAHNTDSFRLNYKLV